MVFSKAEGTGDRQGLPGPCSPDLGQPEPLHSLSSQLASAGLLFSLGLLSPQMPLVLTSTDGLVKRLEELERTAELYKGREESQPRSAWCWSAMGALS